MLIDVGQAGTVYLIAQGGHLLCIDAPALPLQAHLPEDKRRNDVGKYEYIYGGEYTHVLFVLVVAQRALIHLNGVLQSVVERVCYEGMADGHFFQTLHHAGKVAQVIEVEVVAGVDAESAAGGRLCCRYIVGNGSLAVGVVVLRVAFGVELYAVGTCVSGSFYDADNRIGEDGHSDARLAEHLRHIAQVTLLPYGIPAVIGGKLSRVVGYQSDLRGLHFQHQLHKLVLLGVALNIELGGDDAGDLAHIAVADVAFVGAGMHGDAIGAKPLTIYGCLQHTWATAPAAVAQCGYLIDIDRELCLHRHKSKTLFAHHRRG